MGKIYNTQDYVRVQLSYTDATISGDIASVKIKYLNKDITVAAEWAAVHDGAAKTVYYDMPKGSYLSVLGTWKFWIEAVMTDDRILIGEVYKETIYLPSK